MRPALLFIVLLAALLLLPIGVRLRLGAHGTLLMLQLGGLTVRRIDLSVTAKGFRKKRAPTAGQPSSDSSAPDSEETVSATRMLDALGGLRQTVELVRAMLTTATERLLKQIVFPRLFVTLRVGHSDPMQTTLLFAALSGTLHPLAAWVTQTFSVRKYQVDITPDYTQNTFQPEIDIQLWLRIFRIPHTLLGLWPLLKQLRTAYHAAKSSPQGSPSDPEIA